MPYGSSYYEAKEFMDNVSLPGDKESGIFRALTYKANGMEEEAEELLVLTGRRCRRR